MIRNIFLVLCAALSTSAYSMNTQLNNKNKPCCSSFVKKMAVYGYLGTMSVSLTVIGATFDNTACLGMAFFLGSVTVGGIQNEYQKEKSKRLERAHALDHLLADNTGVPKQSRKSIGAH